MATIPTLCCIAFEQRLRYLMPSAMRVYNTAAKFKWLLSQFLLSNILCFPFAIHAIGYQLDIAWNSMLRLFSAYVFVLVEQTYTQNSCAFKVKFHCIISLQYAVKTSSYDRVIKLESRVALMVANSEPNSYLT